MELGSLFTDEPWDGNRVASNYLADIISCVRRKQITSRSGKRILAMLFEGDSRSVRDIVSQEDMTLKPLDKSEYITLAQSILDEKPDMVKDITEKGQVKKVMYFVGQMISRSPEGSVEPGAAEETLKELLGLGEPN